MSAGARWTIPDPAFPDDPNASIEAISVGSNPGWSFGFLAALVGETCVRSHPDWDEATDGPWIRWEPNLVTGGTPDYGWVGDGLHVQELEIKYSVGNNNGAPAASRELVITNWEVGSFSEGVLEIEHEYQGFPDGEKQMQGS